MQTGGSKSLFATMQMLWKSARAWGYVAHDAVFHTNSTLMDRLSVPLKDRQQRLGHSDPTLTLAVYTHGE